MLVSRSRLAFPHTVSPGDVREPDTLLVARKYRRRCRAHYHAWSPYPDLLAGGQRRVVALNDWCGARPSASPSTRNRPTRVFRSQGNGTLTAIRECAARDMIDTLVQYHRQYGRSRDPGRHTPGTYRRPRARPTATGRRSARSARRRRSRAGTGDPAPTGRGAQPAAVGACRRRGPRALATHASRALLNNGA